MVSEDDAFVYRGKINSTRDKIMDEVGHLAKELTLERARSAKLIEALKHIAKYKRDLGGGRLGPTEAADNARQAIAEYEAGD